MKFQVQTANKVRDLPERPGMAPRSVLHVTAIGDDSRAYQLTWFAPTELGVPEPGAIIDGQPGEPDTIDAGRVKFTPAGQGRPQSMQSAPRPAQPAPVYGSSSVGGAGAEALRSRSIQRQHSQEMAIRYLALRAQTDGLGDAGIDLALVGRVASWFEQDITRPQVAPGDVPASTDGDVPWSSDATPPADAAQPFGQTTFGT